jgi:hypothetical protein
MIHVWYTEEQLSSPPSLLVLVYPMIQPDLLFGLPTHVRLEQIEITPSEVILSLAADTSEASCLLWKPASHRVHSRYTRTLQDLPCVGKALRLPLVVRRFVCTKQGCARKIFALISRDRAGEFARGAKEGAPEARPPADRFHVLRNLAEVVEKVLNKHRQALKTIHLVATPTASPSPLLRHLRPDREQRKQQARARLVERYEAVQRRLRQGFSHRAIAQQLHMHRESVIRYDRADRFPEKPSRPVSLVSWLPMKPISEPVFFNQRNDTPPRTEVTPAATGRPDCRGKARS